MHWQVVFYYYLQGNTGTVIKEISLILAILRKSGVCVTEHLGLKELYLLFTSH